MVRIDNKTCLGPKKCGACINSCPNGVFVVIPIGKRIYRKMPEKYEIMPYFREFCNGCGKCIKKCPVKECIILE